MGKEQRWTGSAGDSFANALADLRSRIVPLRAEITELTLALNAREEELTPLEMVEAALEKWRVEAAAETEIAAATEDHSARDAAGGGPAERKSGPATRCDRIIAVMSEDPQRQWRPRDVACGLDEKNVNTVRSLMQYMAGKRRLRKNPDASYQLPTANADSAATGNEGQAASAEAGADDPENVTHAPFGRTRSRHSHAVTVDSQQVLGFLQKNAGRRWRPREVGAHLKISDTDAVREALMDLAGQGLLVKHDHGRFQYVPPGVSAGRAV